MSLFGNATLVNTQAIPVGRAQKLSISYISESITIRGTDGDAILLKEYFTEDDPDLYADISIADDSIVIRHGERPIPNFLRGYIELYLPRNFFGALTVKTVSGRVDAEHRLVLEELTATSTSGRIAIGDLTAGRMVLSTVSGSIGVGSARALADVHSTSGAIQIVSAEGAGTYRTVSGSIEVAFATVTGDLVLGSTSGRIRLMLPETFSYVLEAKSVSGRIHVPGAAPAGKRSVAVTVGDAPRARVRLSTVSGAIEVA